MSCHACVCDTLRDALLSGTITTMRISQPIRLSPSQRRTLERWRRQRATNPRRARRAAILLLAARHWSNERIARRLGTDAHSVARWRLRFLAAGLEAISREERRAGRPPDMFVRHEERVLTATQKQRPPNGRRWSTRSLAAHLGIAHTLVARIWKRSSVVPPQWESCDPAGA
ncbi:MAG: helix-turn-helix domain-containing protein [Phycisphaerae bacterium]